jgi:hypothetical protein
MKEVDYKNLTVFQALFIKYLRIRCDGTWRWVAAKFDERYVDKVPFFLGPTVGGNQMTGLFLCDNARKLLNEPEQGAGWND